MRESMPKKLVTSGNAQRARWSMAHSDTIRGMEGEWCLTFVSTAIGSYQTATWTCDLMLNLKQLGCIGQAGQPKSCRVATFRANNEI